MALSRSRFRPEVNPWTHDEDLHECLMLRGASLAAMESMETIFTEVAIRASRLPVYAAVRADFPSRRAARLQFLKTIIAMPVPSYRLRDSGKMRSSVLRADCHFEMSWLTAICVS